MSADTGVCWAIILKNKAELERYKIIGDSCQMPSVYYFDDTVRASWIRFINS
jgi:hypothetical protein